MRSIIGLLFAGQAAFSAAPEMTPILKDSMKSCAEEAACTVVLSANDKVQVIFKTSRKEQIETLNSVDFKVPGPPGQKSLVQTFQMKDLAGIYFQSEGFDFQEVKLGGRLGTALMLKAFDSATNGPVYYYFFYNPKTRKFVKSNEAYLPIDSLDKKGNQEIFTIGEQKFILTPEFQMQEIPLKNQKKSKAVK